MIKLVKDYVTKNGVTINRYLEKAHRPHEGKWREEGEFITYTVEIPGLSSPAIYKWRVDGNVFFAVNGKALSVTPELDKVKLEQLSRREAISPNDLKIHDFVKNALMEIERIGTVTDTEYEHVLETAAVKFEIPSIEIERISNAVERKIYNLD